uniref:Uncharacterized protein n=1 Tax=Trichuris muris TaxID=70415 RepID=A0A5S6R5E8_TRIMR
MFMQVLMHENNRNVVRLLWRESTKTIAVVNKHAEDNANLCRTMSEAMSTFDDAWKLLKSAGFDMKKCSSNSIEALAPFDDETGGNHANTVLTLGMVRQTTDDTISLRRHSPVLKLPGTKRSILKIAWGLRSVWDCFNLHHCGQGLTPNIVQEKQGKSAHWNQFVSNRTSEIEWLAVPSAWRYCPTKDNSAYLPSRGCFLKKLLKMDLWWNDPV